MCINCGNGSQYLKDDHFQDLLRAIYNDSLDPFRNDNEEITRLRNSGGMVIQVTENVTLKIVEDSSNVDVDTITQTLRNLESVAPSPGKVEVYAPYMRSREEDAEALTGRVNSEGLFDMNISTNMNRVVYIAPQGLTTDMADSKNPLPVFMPSSHITSNVVYTLAHEWGHVIDVRPREFWVTQSVTNKLVRYNLLPTFASSLSDYGATGEPEAYAESFAEWFLTNGKTDNFAANWYAKEYGWAVSNFPITDTSLEDEYNSPYYDI